MLAPIFDEAADKVSAEFPSSKVVLGKVDCDKESKIPSILTGCWIMSNNSNSFFQHPLAPDSIYPSIQHWKLLETANCSKRNTGDRDRPRPLSTLSGNSWSIQSKNSRSSLMFSTVNWTTRSGTLSAILNRKIPPNTPILPNSPPFWKTTACSMRALVTSLGPCIHPANLSLHSGRQKRVRTRPTNRLRAIRRATMNLASGWRTNASHWCARSPSKMPRNWRKRDCRF